MAKVIRAFRFPPGPKGSPLVGNLLQFRRDPAGFSLRMAREYGDAAHFTLGRQHAVQLNSPEFIRDVLVNKQREFSKGRGLGFAKMLFGNGLVTKCRTHPIPKTRNLVFECVPAIARSGT